MERKLTEKMEKAMALRRNSSVEEFLELSVFAEIEDTDDLKNTIYSRNSDLTELVRSFKYLVLMGPDSYDGCHGVTSESPFEIGGTEFEIESEFKSVLPIEVASIEYQGRTLGKMIFQVDVLGDHKVMVTNSKVFAQIMGIDPRLQRDKWNALLPMLEGEGNE